MYLNPNKIIGSGVPVWLTSQILAVNYNFDIIYIYIINLVTLHSWTFKTTVYRYRPTSTNNHSILKNTSVSLHVVGGTIIRGGVLVLVFGNLAGWYYY